MTKPISVSVTMPVHNGERYLDEAVQSILGQTWKDFEFIIVNDGSTDGTAPMLEGYQAADPRVRVFHQERQGCAGASNVACRLARGRYVARMDADDISLPQRLERQVQFLEAHPAISVCGSALIRFGDGPESVLRFPVEDAGIDCALLFYCPVCNPATVVRRDVFFRAGIWYRPEFDTTEDYRFWVDVIRSHSFANLPEPLVRYRRHPQQTTVLKERRIKELAGKIHAELLAELGLAPSEEERRTHAVFGSWQFQRGREFVVQARGWLEKLRQANVRAARYPRREFDDLLAAYWYAVCRANVSEGLWAMNQYRASCLSRGRFLPVLKLAVRCCLSSRRGRQAQPLAQS
jgi:hypothetical protein